MDKGRRTLKLLLIPLLLGTAVSLVLYLALGRQHTTVQAAPLDVVSVVVAKGAIPAHAVITDAMLQSRQLPRTLVSQNEVRDAKQAIGQVTTMPLMDGEVVLTSKLGGTDKGLAYQIPKGKRAITMRVDEISGVGGYPEVGDTVDLIITISSKDKSTQSRLLLQAVPILAKGPIAPAPTPSGKATPTTDAKLPSSYTLALPPQQSVQIALAEEISHVKFILRPASDDGTVNTISLDEGSIGVPAAPAPAPAPSKP